MEKIGLFEAIDQATEYRKMLPVNRAQLRKKRLYELVSYAKEHSPLYARLYKDLPANYTLQDLPHTNRDTILSNYKDWSTDRDVTEYDIKDYLSTDYNPKRLFRKKYHVVSSGGTDSEPLINLYDDNFCRITAVEHVLKGLPRLEYIWSFELKRGRYAAIYTVNGPFFYNMFIKIRSEYLPLSKKRFLTLPAQASTEELTESLNKFKPTILSGFPSVLLRLADAKTSGLLHIRPICIIADGEFLEDEARAKLSAVFECEVTSTYSSAETGVIAYECREHHLHINDDRIILEPIDSLGRAVPAGKESEMVLVTNLFSYPQPVIRYALEDRVIVHDEECLCGNPSPWISISGRSRDRLRLVDGGRNIIVPIVDMEEVLKEEESISRYQIIIYAGSRLSLRLTAASGYDRTTAFFKAEKLMRSYMKSIGVMSPMITLDKDEPSPDPLTGKFRTIIVES